ncbi:MAG: methionyl aminopeptidase [Lachnospiraceae bacterium]
MNLFGKCWCGSGLKYNVCHKNYDKKIAVFKRTGHRVPPRSIIKNSYDIEMMKKSAAINMAVLDYVGANIKAGMTTEEIDRMVYEKTTELGGIPAPLNYGGFPKSVCTSINNQVCHGIPSEDIVIADGDIINVDVSTILDGYYSDSSRMYMIGQVSKERQKLVQVAKECVEKGLEAVRPWGYLGDVGFAVNSHAIANGFSVVEDVGGHGIGHRFHENPFVCYVTNKNTGMVLAPGMVFTIEPMVNAGKPEVFIDDNNGWTIYTDDGSDSAQWEIMVLVTETGHEVLCW